MKLTSKDANVNRGRRFASASVLLILVVLLVGPAQVATAGWGAWGDSSLIHACKDSRGRLTVVAPTDSCNQYETQVTWLKDVEAGDGLTINRNTSGATLSLASDASTGWSPAGETWAHATSNQFTVLGDLTVKYRTGAKIKLTQTAVKYFYVVSSSHTGGTTTVTVTGGSDYQIANVAVSSPYLSYQATPQGFPDWFNWSPGLVWDGTAPTSATQSIARFSIIGRTVFIRLKYEYATAGSNNKAVFFAVPVTANGQASEYNTPGSGYMSSGAAGSPPSISAHVAFQYGTGGEIYVFIDNGATVRSLWVSLFYEI